MKFFVDSGAIVSAQLTSENYRRSPIAQGGMESQTIPSACVNILLMEKYKQLMQQLYIAPKNEKTIGSFLQANETIDGAEAQSVSKKAKVKRKQTNKIINWQKDIHHFLKKQQGIITNTEARSKKPLVIMIDE